MRDDRVEEGRKGQVRVGQRCREGRRGLERVGQGRVM